MPGASQNQGETIQEKFRTINEELADGKENLPPITLSAGVAFWDRPNPRGSIFKDADSMLLKLKKTRKNRCAVYNG
jgi:GGDEF domain-containing protein